LTNGHLFKVASALQSQSGAASRLVRTVTGVIEGMVAAVQPYVLKLIIRLRPSFILLTG